MARCKTCNALMVGGVTEGENRYCSQRCQAVAHMRDMMARLPDDLVAEEVRKVHQGPCPRCKKAGPVDVHDSHFVWSLIFLTRRTSKAHVCCKSCARSEQTSALVGSLFAGWWGFPWGFIYTPMQIGRNISAMSGGPNPAAPSPRLQEFVRAKLAQQVLIQAHQPEAAMEPAQAAGPSRA